MLDGEQWVHQIRNNNLHLALDCPQVCLVLERLVMSWLHSPRRLSQKRPSGFQNGWPAHWRTRWTSALVWDHETPDRAARCSPPRWRPGDLLDWWSLLVLQMGTRAWSAWSTCPPNTHTHTISLSMCFLLSFISLNIAKYVHASFNPWPRCLSNNLNYFGVCSRVCGAALS